MINLLISSVKFSIYFLEKEVHVINLNLKRKSELRQGNRILIQAYWPSELIYLNSIFFRGEISTRDPSAWSSKAGTDEVA